MILGLVLSSMLMKAQAFLCLSRRLAISIGRSRCRWRCATIISDWAIFIRRNLGMPSLPKLLPSSEPMVTVPDMRRLALGCPGSECSEYQHPLSIRWVSPEWADDAVGGLCGQEISVYAEAFYTLPEIGQLSDGKSEIPVRRIEVRIKPSIVGLPQLSLIEGFLYLITNTFSSRLLELLHTE